MILDKSCEPALNDGLMRSLGTLKYGENTSAYCSLIGSLGLTIVYRASKNTALMGILSFVRWNIYERRARRYVVVEFEPS